MHSKATSLIAGTFGTTPQWVDTKLKPGASSQTKELGFAKTMHSITHLEYFIWSPNLVWFTMALAIHVFFPYPIEEAKSQGFALSWMLSRFCLNYTVALAYYGFFYVGLYWRKWATRKYRPGVDPNSLHCTVNPNPIDQVLTPTPYTAL